MIVLSLAFSLKASTSKMDILSLDSLSIEKDRLRCFVLQKSSK